MEQESKYNIINFDPEVLREYDIRGGVDKNITEDTIFDLRPEKLSGNDFIALTKKIDHGQLST